MLWYGYHFIGLSETNNVAEYHGLIEGLKEAVAMNLNNILIQGDSKLVIQQTRGEYKVTKDHLKVLHTEVMQLLSQIPKHTLEYIPRAQNHRADALSNICYKYTEK